MTQLYDTRQKDGRQGQNCMRAKITPATLLMMDTVRSSTKAGKEVISRSRSRAVGTEMDRDRPDLPTEVVVDYGAPPDALVSLG